MTKKFTAADLPALLREVETADLEAVQAETLAANHSQYRDGQLKTVLELKAKGAAAKDPAVWASSKAEQEEAEKRAATYDRTAQDNINAAKTHRAIAAGAREKIAQIRRDEETAAAKAVSDIEDLM
jgi:hypothetical protein